MDGERARQERLRARILAERDYFLRKEWQATRALMEDVSRGAFTYAPPTQAILDRAMHIDRESASLGLGLVDASIDGRQTATGA